MAAPLEAPPATARPLTPTARAPRAWLAWPRLPAAAELATIGAGYVGYALVRLAIHADRHAAFAHAAQLAQAERHLQLGIEPWLNGLAAAHPPLAEAAGYYYGLLHFIITPLVLAWLYWRRPAAFGRLRSALVLTTTAANVVFWAWPVAPPRLSEPGMTDILVTHDILGAANPHGATSLVNLYAAMPSLHVAWAAWCTTAIVITSRTRWRHLAWLYPAATTLVVLATANHFLLDAVGGLAVTGLGMLATSRPGPLSAGRIAWSAHSRHWHPQAPWAPARVSSPSTARELEGAQDDVEALVNPGTEAARQGIADCDASLRQHRAALEAGASPEIVTAWINETQAKRAGAEARLLHQSTGRRRMTREEIISLVNALGDLMTLLSEADPADKAEVYQQTGLSLTYDPAAKRVKAEARHYGSYDIGALTAAVLAAKAEAATSDVRAARAE